MRRRSLTRDVRSRGPGIPSGGAGCRRRSEVAPHGHTLDLHARALRQAGGGDRRARRRRLPERRAVHLVHRREVLHVGQVDRRLHHVGERQAGTAQHGGEVLHDAAGLLLHPARHQLARPGIDADLARRVHQLLAAAPAHHLGLHIRPDRPRGVLHVQAALHGFLRKLRHSTVTLFARLRGWSTSQPRATAMSYASSCSGITDRIGCSMGIVAGTYSTWSAREDTSVSPSVATAMMRPLRPRTSIMLLMTFSYAEARVQMNTTGMCSSMSAIGPCFISAAG